MFLAHRAKGVAVEFRLDEAQVGLQETVARFCGDRFPFDAIASREGASLDRQRWKELADLGVFSLLLGEDAGGSGLGALEAALVFEQLAAHLVAGPMMWTLLAGPLVDGAATGEVVVGGVGAEAVTDGAALVEHGADLDVLLVVSDDRVERYRLSDLDPPVALEPLDPLTPVARVAGLAGGTSVGDAAASRDLRNLGTVLASAGLSGVASRSLEVARTYALEREQFNTPIGSFQAVKHMLADMFVRSGLAQSASYAAAAVLGDPGDEDPTAILDSAKVVSTDAAITNASAAVQILGGMGFTWDMLPNYLLKRAWLLEHSFGTSADHALAIGRRLAEATR